jgi:hypothetical protein
MKTFFKLLFYSGLIASFFTQNVALGAVSIGGLYFVNAKSFAMTGFAFAPIFPVNLVGACEPIVEEAARLAGQNYAFNLQKRTGALDAITSPENTAGAVDATLLSFDSERKTGQLKVYYDQRTKDCQITNDCDQSVCDPGSTPVRKSFIVTIDNCIKTPVRLYSNEEMVVLCKDPATWMRERGFNDLRAAREKLDQYILAEYDNQIGVNYEWDGTTTAAGSYKNVQLLATSGGQQLPLPGNWGDVILDYQNNQLTGTPLIFGQGNYQKFAQLHRMSCCNSATPYGEAVVDGDSRFYLDQSANSVLGSNRFIVTAPGALRLVTFNENRNLDIRQPTEMHIVVPDPAGYPFSWNLDWYFDNCTKSWKMMYSLHWTVFNTFRADSFAGDGAGDSPDTSPDCADSLLGMLGVFGYTATAA